MVGAAADTVALADATAEVEVGVEVNLRLPRRLARVCEEIRTEPAAGRRFGERRNDCFSR